MAETIEKNTQEEIIDVKPYTFRKLASGDVFLMFRIISLIGINQFAECLEKDGVQKKLTELMRKSTDEEGEKQERSVEAVGIALVFEIASVIINNLPRCEREIYQLLSQTSNMSIEEISAEGNAVMFFEMVIDFLKKEEFPDFIKVVSRLFK